MKTLFKFILLTGLRDKLYLSLLLILLGAFGLSNLVGFSALSEQTQMQVVYFSFLSRVIIVCGITLFICFYINKEFEKKEIDFIKSKTDSESLIKDYSSTAKDIAEGVEHLNDASLGNKVVSEILSGIADGATIGVMVNNLITIESYKIVSSAIDNHLKSLDEGFKLTENTVKQELEKNNNIDVLLKNTTINVKNKINRMNEKDGLSWASKINNIVKDIRKQIGNNSDVETIGHENITIIKCHH